MPLHVHMAIGTERNALCLQQRALATPAGSRTTLLVDHPMAGQRLGIRGIAQRAPHHARMTRPARPSRNGAVGRHPPSWYLADDVQHIVAKAAGLLGRHLVGIVFV